jgi:hypothetical protein
MKRIAMISAVVATLASLAILFANHRSQAAEQAQPTDFGRYSSEVVLVPPMNLTVWITDRRDQKLYMYLSKEQSLELKATVDLSKTGSPEIPIVKVPEPATRPAK